MKRIRVIPCLDIADGRVVKGVNFVQLRDAGDPVELAKAYVAQGADELVFLDVTATHEGRDTTFEAVRDTAKHVSIDFAVGGGVRSLDDAKKLLEAGATKVGVNSAAITNPALINEIASELGSEKLVLSLDVKKVDVKKSDAVPSGYVIVTHGGRNDTGIDAVEWAKEVESRGAGEILLTSMDTDGTQDGFDTELLSKISTAVGIGVIASGGAGTLEHFVQAAKAGASAVLAASVFHNATFRVAEVKSALKEAGFDVV